MNISTLINHYSSDGILDETEFRTLKLEAHKQGMSSQQLNALILSQRLVIGIPISISLDMRSIETLVANEYGELFLKLKVSKLPIGYVTGVEVFSKLSLSDQVSHKTITNPSVGKAEEVSLPIRPLGAGICKLQLWVKIQTDFHRTVWFSLPTPIAFEINNRVQLQNVHLEVGNKSVVTGSLLGNQKKNRMVQASIWESAKLIPKEFVHAAQFFNMVYPEALVQDIHYVNSFSGSLLTHPHFATLDGQTQIGFVNGAKPCSIGMIGSADFFLLNEESEDVLRFIDTVHCILDPNQQRLKDNGSVNGTALQGATTINNHSVEKPVSIVNLAGKIYLSCHNHRTSSNKWNVWELVQQTSKTKKQVFLVSEFDTIPFVYDGGMFVNTFQQTNLDRKDNAFSVAWRKGGVVFINDSFQTIEFFDKNSYEECIFRLYPNEALYLTQDTPTYLRVHRHKLKLFSYTPSQSGSVDKHAQRVVEVSKTAPRIERAELTNGHLFEGRFQIVQQMYSTMCSRYYLCKDTVLNSICVVQIFTVGLSPLLQQKILSSQDFFKRVDTAVIPNEMRLNGEIAYCVWPKCIHDATLTRHSAEMKRLAYVRQIIEIAIVLKANDRITTELFPSTLIVEQNDRLHFSGWLNTLREPTGPSDSDSPLLSSLFCTIIYFIAENQMVLDEKQWVLSEMVSAIPSSYSSFAGMCQKFLTSKQAYLHDLLEIFSVTKLTEKHRLQQIEQIVQRAADVGISIQLSLNSSPEEIAKYERLFGQITPQKKSEKNPVDMSVQNSDVQKKYEMIFIKSGGFFNEQGTVRRIVKLTNPFYASNILVTEGLYASLNPSFITNCPNSPKVNISWLDAVLFCNQLSESEGLSPVYRVRSDGTIRWRKARDGYRLPTEAEWELCVRANGQIQQTIWAQSDEPNKLPDVAVHDPNGYGIYDMIGLVWEWCWDVFEPLESGTFQDPVVDNGSTSEHVVRGGSMKESLASISTHSRTGHEDQHQSPWVGFRVYRNI